MRRKQAIFLTLTLTLLAALVILPTGFAKRAGRGTSPEPRKAEAAPAAGAAAASRPLAALARLQASEPVVSQAVGFAVSPAVRDLPPEEGLKLDPEAEANKVVKSNPNKIIRTGAPEAVPDAHDMALQSSAPSLSAVAAAPTAGVSFDGIDSQANIPVFGGLVMPPDTVGDVGPNHYVQMVNSNWRVWNKSGTPLTPVMSLGSLWTAAGIGAPCGGSNDGDPVVLYDSFADRWMLSQFCVDPVPSHQLIAISVTGDPTGAYYLYDFVMPNAKFNDYPHFGVWPNGYYMTNNQFNQAGTAFQGAGFYAFDRAKMLAGNPTASYIYFDSCPTNTGCVVGGVLPADADGLIPPPAGAPNPFVYFTANEFGDPSDGLRIFDFHANFANPAGSTFTERAESPVAVAAFNPLDPSGRQDIEQQGTTAGLDSIQDRVLHRLQYRRFADGRESLITNHTVNVGTGTTVATHQSGVRYYELRRTGGGPYAVAEQASFAPDAHNRWMGSAAMDNAGNLAVGYSASSSTLFPSIRYAARLAADPPNGLHQGEATMHAGTGSQTSTSGRWGDYSSLNVDPVDDCTFWFTTEYYASPNSSANWRTRIGSFSFAPGQCQAPAQGTLKVNVTNCDSGLPVSGVSVSVNNNLFTSTMPSGMAQTRLSPGAYTVSLTAPNYFPVTVNNVQIADGQTTAVTQCISGAPSITGGGSQLVAESCSPADNALSPGETVTLNFGLKNNGTASTSNLTATLLATGGVQSPSAAQNYGAIPPDNTVVSRPFTFTVDPSLPCGSVVTATLSLQDGANSLGTITYALQVGGLGPPATATHGTGNISTPIPDVNTVDIPINVTATGIVSDVNVRVRLNHTFDGDLELRLVHPDGTVVLLSDNRGGTGDNYGAGANDCSGTPTVFDDQAAPTIASGAAPFVGSFKPEQALSALNGKSTAGVWKLRVTDTASLDTGTVGCVTLELTRNRFVCCGVAGTPEIKAAPPATIEEESCTPPNMAVDPEETVTVNFPVVNTGDGPTTNLVATLQNSGGVVPVTTSQSYGAVSPIGGPVSRPFSFVAQGSCGNIITATLQLQDGVTNLGTITYTFRLGTTATGTHTFSNNSPVAIPGTGTGASTGAPGNPYPSSINVAGVAGTVQRVAVRLKNFNHTWPNDVDMLLVGPGGQRMVILSDAVGSGPGITARTYLLDDTAAAVLPSTGNPASGTYRPTNVGTGDPFPAPAPPQPHQNPAPGGAATFASVFGGQNPNGIWSLYVVDDVSGDVGSITGGWDLVITTQDPVCCNTACTITVPADITRPNDAGACGAIVNYAPATISGSCGVLSYSHPSGSFFPVGTTTVTVTATRSDNTTTTETFDITVVDNEAPSANVSASPNVLWSPNHRMRDVTISTTATDNCPGAVNCVITDITSNEAVAGPGGGAGNTSPDWLLVNPSNLVQLRAERSGSGTSRVYTITVECTDSAGNKTTRSTTVSVPHNQ
ncbi:MAG TPA: proprotein convertase P-domain-containing protein [Pyrinomonadaceae bacterium]|nr:proprotein convertase P-domain-containing protein [Pyrinomonadaceae bacterium]